jgi:hypothetical protein
VVDEYPLGDVLAFAGLPLLLMIPPALLLVVVVIAFAVLLIRRVA